MSKAEEILEKHINDNDLNFVFHEKTELWNELLNAVNEALNIPCVTNSYKLTESEQKAFKMHESKIVQFEHGGGIGIKVKCLTKTGTWVDITDYNCW